MRSGLSGLTIGTVVFCAFSTLFASPVAHWAFNESSGLVAADSSVNGYDGDLINMDGTEWTSQVFGNALAFDGNNSYIEVTGYKGITGSAARTCTALIKIASSSDNQMIISWGSSAPGQAWMFYVTPTGQLGVALFGGSILGTRILNDGNWHHLAVTLGNDLNGDGRIWVEDIVLYVDGMIDPISSYNTGSDPLAQVNTVADDDLTIGVRNYGPSHPLGYSFNFNGMMGDVRIYDRDLSEEEILTAMPGLTNGAGTENDPFQISIPDELIFIRSNPNLLNKHFVLINDIYFDPDTNPDHTFDQALIAPDIDNTTAGYQGTPFSGTFDGNNHSIYNLTFLTDNRYIGMFGYVQASSPFSISVKDLTLESPSITQVFQYSGCLAGYVYQSKIKDCIVHNGTVIGSSTSMRLGGLIGCNNLGSIIRCQSNCVIRGNQYLGGMIGENYSGTLSNSHSEGEVLGREGSRYIGGLVGFNNMYSTISKCSSDTFVSGTYFLGGLIGRNVNVCSVIQCFSKGSIEGDLFSVAIGGLIGGNDNGMISNCYSSASVVGRDIIGGLVGDNCGTITNSYCIGIVRNNIYNERYGGLVGDALCVNSDPIYSYFLESAGPDNGYGIPMDDPNMMVQANFVGWDFMGESVNGDNDIWRMCVDGVDTPRLSWEFAQNGDFACGDGVDFDDLAALAEHWLLVGTAQPTEFNYACDGNGDGVIDLGDFGVLAENWE